MENGNICCIINFLIFYFQRGKEGERGGEKHQYVVASCVPPTGDLALNPGMCPDWESNQQPFGLQASTQSTEPHQPGAICCILSPLYLHHYKNVGIMIKAQTRSEIAKILERKVYLDSEFPGFFLLMYVEVILNVKVKWKYC